MLRVSVCAVLCGAATLCSPAVAQVSLRSAAVPAASPTLPDGFYLEAVAGGTAFTLPTDAAFTPDGRALVTEKGGRLFVVEGGTARPVLDLTDEVLESGDRGLLAVAVDPAFAANGYVYLAYTVAVDDVEGNRFDAFGRVTRYTLAGGAVDPASRHVVLGRTFAEGIPTCYYSHSVGTLAFGLDGTLFVGTGDGASYAGADAGGLYPECFGPGRFPESQDIGAFRAQALESLSGKILRVDPVTGVGLASNPFYTGTPSDNASRVWALGFRNPFRFTIDRTTGSPAAAAANPGTLWVADVGFAEWEEVGQIRRGDNGGWPCREGDVVLGVYASDTDRGRRTCGALATASPAFVWHHSDTARSRPPGRVGTSVVGGPVYRGTGYPEAYRGRLFYGDYGAGWLASASAASGALADDATFAPDAGPIVDIEADPATGDLHLLQIFPGTLWRLRHRGAGNTAPVAQAGASVRQGGAPLPVQFSGSASFDPDGDALAFAWDFGDGTGSAEADPAHTFASPGTFAVRLTVTDPWGASASTGLTVTVRSGTAPTATITAPTPGTSAEPGTTLALSGRGDDPDQSSSSLTYAWDVTLVHNEHRHPGAFSASGRSASYTVPFHGDAGEFYALLVRLTVTDRDGLTGTDERLVPIAGAGTVDVTAQGVPVARVTAPTGGGSRSLETLRDGIVPAPTTGPADYALQYDTFDDDPAPADEWLGYTFDRAWTFGRVHFVEGIQFDDGGWFETLGVQVRQSGTWRDVAGLVVSPVYGGANGRHFDAYTLSFSPTTGDGVRIIGRAGGSARFVSAAELRVVTAVASGGALPGGWASADVGTGLAPGSASAAGATFTVRGGGDLWGDADAFHFVYQTLRGDGTVTARLGALAAANGWAKAGLMVRAGLGASAPHATILGTPSNGVHLQSRGQAGGETAWQPGYGLALPQWLRLERAGTTVRAFTSTDGQSWALFGTTQIALGADAYVGLMTTSTDFSGRNDLATATFDGVSVSAGTAPPPPGPPPSGGLPEGWAAADLGAPQATGSTARDGDAFVLTGGGDLWGDTDAGHFAHVALTGDGSLVARLESLSARSGWAKAGLMARASLDASAPQVMVVGTPQNGTHLQWRPAARAEMEWTEGYERPLGWLRLDRAGDVFTAFTSADGATWQPLGTATVPMPQTVLIGLAATASDFESRSEVATARFSSVTLAGTVTGGTPPPETPTPGALPDGWAATDVGQAVPGGTDYASGVYTLRGGGDLWGDTDGFHFAHRTYTGDFVLTGRLDALTAVNPWAKAGLMVRAGTGAQAPHAMVVAAPGHGVHFQYRTETAGETQWRAGDESRRAPVWLRLQRAGSALTAFVSSDGQAWETIGTATVPLPDRVEGGLVASSTDYVGRGDLASARFSSVGVAGTAGVAPASLIPPPSVQTQIATRFGIETVYPNPIRSGRDATVRVGIEHPGQYRIETFDTLGRIVFEVSLREEAPIVRNLTVPLRGVGAGLYLVRVTDGMGQSATRTITVVR